MNRLAALFQFILGFILGVVLLAGGTAALAYVVFSRMAKAPEKPIFAEEVKKTEKFAQKDVTTSGKTPKPVVKEETTQPEPKPATKAAEKPQEKPEDKLPSGAYQARVTWSSGLSLRAEPSTQSSRVGGVDYNTKLIILETSSDGKWQKIRVSESGQEGWIKTGNVSKVDE